MLDQLDLVHMNGRIYDPAIARFLSPDPLIQDPLFSQSFNRYSYVWNNPTNMVDPTGFAVSAVSSESGSAGTASSWNNRDGVIDTMDDGKAGAGGKDNSNGGGSSSTNNDNVPTVVVSGPRGGTSTAATGVAGRGERWCWWTGGYQAGNV